MAGIVVTIRCGGQLLDPAVEVLELEVHRELNRVPEARLVLHDGKPAQGRFALSSAALLLPGQPVTVALRQDGDSTDTVVFEGLVLRHAVQAGHDGTRLRLELKDKAFTLTRRRKSAVFADKTDADIIGELLQQAGITRQGSPPAGPIHKELVQFQASDWDFIVSRADVMGLLVDVHRGALTLAGMAPSGAAARSFRYGVDDFFEFELEIDGAQQWAEIDSVGWDVAGQQPLGPAQATQPQARVGDLDAAAMARDLGGGQCTLRHAAALEQDELDAWASARLLRSRLSLLRGRMVIACDTRLAPLDLLQLVGVGSHFDGNVLVSAVTHRFDAEGWKTELRLGLPAEWFAHRSDIAELPAGGLLPPVTGLQIAKVAAFTEDPAGEHRIRLQWPVLDDQQQGSVWARVLRPDAGEQRGCTFWPVEDDEVVVGFLGNDPRQALVLGALHSSSLAPPDFVGPPGDPGGKGAIVSGSGAVIGYEDIASDKSRITVSTPDGRELVLDDDAGQISLSDGFGNLIVLDDQGITISTDQDFIVKAKGQVAISGDKVDIQ